MSELTHGEFDQRPDGWNMVDLTPPTPGVLTRHTFYVDYGEGDRTDEFYQADEANDALTTLRATIEQQAQELAESERKLREVCMEHGPALIEIHDLKKELAASQTRCAKFEAIVRDHQNGACNRTIAQFQATLTAREEVIGQQEATIRGYRHSVKIIGQQHDDRKAERDAAMQEAGRLREALEYYAQTAIGARAIAALKAQQAAGDSPAGQTPPNFREAP